MNVTAHQEKKKKEEETKTGMNKTGEGRRKATDFREPVCSPSAVVQGTARRKNGLRGVPRGTGTLGKTNSHFDPIQTGLGTAPPCRGGC